MSESVKLQTQAEPGAESDQSRKGSAWIIAAIVLIVLAVTAGIVVLAGQSGSHHQSTHFFIILLALKCSRWYSLDNPDYSNRGSHQSDSE